MHGHHTSRLGLLFGSFDPTHNGHLEIIDQALGQCDQVRLIVQPTNVYKNSPSKASIQQRIKMAKLATERLYPYDRSDLSYNQSSRQVRPVISVYELESAVQPSHSILETLVSLRNENQERELFLFLGQDLATSLPTWKDYHQILALARVIEVKRSQAAIASNQIKRLVKRGGSIAELVPPEVADYINEQWLYR